MRAVGHCGECHTPRGLTQATDNTRFLGGTPKGPDGDPVPNITPDKDTGLTWSEDEIAEYLGSGNKPDGDVAGGLMDEVIEGTTGGYKDLTKEDRLAIARYLKSIPAVRNKVTKRDRVHPTPGRDPRVPPPPAIEGGRMKRFAARASVVVGSLVALLLGIAVSQAQMKVGTGDPVADRQRLMKLNGASAKDLNDKVKAGQIEAMAVNAETIAMNAQHIPMLFPKGSLTDKSKAKPEIWEKWAEFEAAAKNMETKAIELRDAARAKDQAKVEAVMKDFGRQACGSLPHAVPRAPAAAVGVLPPARG